MTGSYSDLERIFILEQVSARYGLQMPSNSNPNSYSDLAKTIQQALESAGPAVSPTLSTFVTDSALRRLIYYRVLSCEPQLLDALYLYSTSGAYDRQAYLKTHQLPDAQALVTIEQQKDNWTSLLDFVRKFPSSEHLPKVLGYLQDLLARRNSRPDFFTKNVLYGALAISVLLAAIGYALRPHLQPEEKFVWNLVTTWPDNSTYSAVLREFAAEVETTIKKETGVDLTIKINYNSHLPNGETPNDPEKLLNFLKGTSPTIDMLHTTPYYFNHGYPRTTLYSAVPFGRFKSQMLEWLKDPEVYNGLRYIFCTPQDSSVYTYPGGFTGAQYAGWFKFDHAEQFYTQMNQNKLFRGKRGRYAGFAGQILFHYFTSPIPIERVQPSEIAKTAFNNHFDFYEWVGPGMDMEIGLHAIKNFNVYCLSSWHEPCTMFTLSVNIHKLNALGKANPMARKIFERTVQEYFDPNGDDRVFLKTTQANQSSLEKFPQLGIETVQFSLPYLERLRGYSNAYLESFFNGLDTSKPENISTRKLYESYKVNNETILYQNAALRSDYSSPPK